MRKSGLRNCLTSFLLAGIHVSATGNNPVYYGEIVVERRLLTPPLTTGGG